MQFIGKPIIGPSGSVLPLSAAVRVGDCVYLSGQVALRDSRVVEGGVGAQTHAILDGVEATLQDGGLGLADVFKVTVWLVNAADFAAFNEAYASRFAAPFPVRSTVVSNLVLPDALLEIEIVARVPSAESKQG